MNKEEIIQMLKDNPIKIIKYGDIEIPVEYLKQTTVNVNGDDYVRLQQENKQLKDLIDTILNFSFFKEECPLNFGFENNTNEDKSQNIFYEDEWCENNCNNNYKDCWLKYFEKLQELEGSDSNE